MPVKPSWTSQIKASQTVNYWAHKIFLQKLDSGPRRSISWKRIWITYQITGNHCWPHYTTWLNRKSPQRPLPKPSPLPKTHVGPRITSVHTSQKPQKLFICLMTEGQNVICSGTFSWTVSWGDNREGNCWVTEMRKMKSRFTKQLNEYTSG